MTHTITRQAYKRHAVQRLAALLARMFHQSLLYGPGGASDRAIWAFLMV
jgi:hypothetical protein